jgi:hypothetical protein
MTLIRYFVLALFFITAVQAVPKKAHLFVALCDNASQGIMPVLAAFIPSNPSKLASSSSSAASISHHANGSCAIFLIDPIFP